jgi:hypothetical protein
MNDKSLRVLASIGLGTVSPLRSSRCAALCSSGSIGHYPRPKSDITFLPPLLAQSEHLIGGFTRTFRSTVCQSETRAPRSRT